MSVKAVVHCTAAKVMVYDQARKSRLLNARVLQARVRAVHSVFDNDVS
jgi:hypothetical protein